MSLTSKQSQFVLEYLTDLNATKAAIRAGYSPETARQIASENLSKPDIQEAIQYAIEARSKRTGVTQDMVVNELKRIAFASMKNVARWGASGVAMKESEELSEDDIATVQEASETTNQHGGSLKIRQYDKVKALELLGRHLGMWQAKVEGVPTEDQPLAELSDNELHERWLKARAPKGSVP